MGRWYPGHHSLNGRNGAHLGYSLYRCGPDSEPDKQYIKCVLRPARIPATADPRIVANLPTPLLWPQGDMERARRALDAVYAIDLGQLRGWGADWPEHTFGWEGFIEWADRHLRLGKAGGIPAAKRARARLFPSRWLERMPIGVPLQIAGGRVEVRLHVVSFATDEAAVSVSLRLRADRSVLSRVYVDAHDGSYEVKEHYPARYQLAGLPPMIVTRLLGLGDARLPRVRDALDRPASAGDQAATPDAFPTRMPLPAAG